MPGAHLAQIVRRIGGVEVGRFLRQVAAELRRSEQVVGAGGVRVVGRPRTTMTDILPVASPPSSQAGR